jgi:hypothetical protein
MFLTCACFCQKIIPDAPAPSVRISARLAICPRWRFQTFTTRLRTMTFVSRIPESPFRSEGFRDADCNSTMIDRVGLSSSCWTEPWSKTSRKTDRRARGGLTSALELTARATSTGAMTNSGSRCMLSNHRASWAAGLANNTMENSNSKNKCEAHEANFA